MALMGFRGPNQVQWVGVRPGHRGTQVFKEVAVAGGTAIVHTVTVGKKLYLLEWGLSQPTNVAAYYSLSVRNVADVLVRHLAIARMAVGHASRTDGRSVFPPIELPASYDIVVYSEAAGCVAYGWIFGWEE